MRFKELLEYKRDITANNFGDKLATRFVNDTSFVGIMSREGRMNVSDLFHANEGDKRWVPNDRESVDKVVDLGLNIIEKKDPSPNKQYVQWIVMRYLDGSISMFEDILTTIETILRKHHELKTRRALPPEVADIGKFKTKESITTLWRTVNNAYDALERKLSDAPALSKGDSTEILNNNEFRIIIPHDEEASCYYGQGTQWCTAARNNNMFNNYAGDGPMFIVMPKESIPYSGDKFQLHFCSGQIMDETDSDVMLSEIGLDDKKYGKLFAKYDSCAKHYLEFHTFNDIKAVVAQILKYVNKYKDEIKSGGVADALTWDITTLTSRALDDLYELHDNDSSVPYTITEIPTVVADILDEDSEKILWQFIYDNIDVWVDDDFNVTTKCTYKK